MKINSIQGLQTCLMLLVTFFSASCTKQLANTEAAPAVEKGVSEALASYRSRVISKLAYTISLDIPADKEAPVQGSQRIEFQLEENHVPLQIDFKEETSHLLNVQANGQAVAIDHRNEHLIIPASQLQPGKNTVDIRFIAGNLSLNRNEDYLYTLLVPDRARTLMPVFDQPSLKASFQLSLTIPGDWQALTNAPLLDSTSSGARKTLNFGPSDTISTYLFSFAAGKFNPISRNVRGTPMRFYHRETDETKIKLSMDPIFEIHADALRFMEDYTGIPYPFQKFDLIAIPDFQYGGMEHVGAIDYKASSLFLDEGATKDQKISRANLIAHETAHMWFGDLVTMQWFNDVWMKEVFANFMADKISQVSLEDTNYDLKFLIDHFPAAYGTDRTSGANPIRQPLTNLQDAGSLYGAIIYHKAPIMMRQLERIMGERAFQQGLQQYLKRYAYRNATWPELIEILDAGTALDLQAWNQVWVNEPGRPVFTWDLNTAGGKITALRVKQQAEDGSDRLWPQYFEVLLVYPDRLEEVSVNMNQREIQLEEVAGKEVPRYVLFNSSGQGYGVFPVDEQMMPHVFSLKNPVARASAYINLYENMLNERSMGPRQLLDRYRSGLGQESEELNLKLMTGQLSDIYWRLLPAAARIALAATLEQEVWEAMQQQVDGNAKKHLFKAYQSIALSQKAQENLYNLWEKEAAPAGVTLTEDDYTALALALAVRDYPAAKPILPTQIERIKNPDRKKRLQFMIPALSADVEVRDAFFASLKDPAMREKEAWVSTALSYLHHPLRRESSGRYLAESLELLEEIQQTGDIFFPYAWLQSSFGSYSGPAEAAVVREFLAQHPDYNPKLKAKILQAADNLFRAEKLLKAQP